MFDWIFQHFQKKEPFKAPLYLQHQGLAEIGSHLHFTCCFMKVLIFHYPLSGHSRTVVGMEVLKNGDKMLLILDPGVGRYQMEKSLGNWNSSSSLQLLRKSLYAMKSEQFQIATVVGIVSSEQEFQVINIFFFLRFPVLGISTYFRLLRIINDEYCKIIFLSFIMNECVKLF